MWEADRLDHLLLEALRLGWLARCDIAQRPTSFSLLPMPALNQSRIDAVLKRAAEDQVDGLVALGLQQMGAKEAEVRSRERVKEASFRSLWIQSGRDRVQKALEADGIFPVWLKGAVGDALFWKGQGLRGTTDLDILIAPDEVERADAVLMRLGYRYAPESGHAVSETFKPERLYLAQNRNRDVDVDLHMGVLKSPPYIECAPELRGRARHYETAFGSILALSKEDMLAHAAGNLAGSKFVGRLKLLLDAATLICEPELDLDEVVERVSRWGCAWALWGLFRLCEVRFGLPIEERHVQAVAPRTLAQRTLVEAVVGVWGRPRVPQSGLGRLTLVEWPLLERPLWPLEAGTRHVAHRVADRWEAWRS